MVIGLFANPNHAAVCLSNLAEEDFSPSGISVIMKTPTEAASISRSSGPLTGLTPDNLVTWLSQHGLTLADAEVYRQGVASGGVFLAVLAGDASAAAQETLHDHNAQAVRMVGD